MLNLVSRVKLPQPDVYFGDISVGTIYTLSDRATTYFMKVSTPCLPGVMAICLANGLYGYGPTCPIFPVYNKIEVTPQGLE